MQDNYVGDIGNFAKHGLLRYLTGMTGDPPTAPSLRLGVVWYVAKNDSSGGNLTGYLFSKSPLRDLDPTLYDTLRRLLCEDKRKISEVQLAGILPRNTAYFKRYEDWRPALAVNADVDLVFVDPDNGIAVGDAQKGPKYATIDELCTFAEHKSLVIYHHLDRQPKQQRIERLSGLLRKLGRAWRTLQWHRLSSRYFFIVPHKDHTATLEDRLKTFCNTEWVKQRHFTWETM